MLKMLLASSSLSLVLLLTPVMTYSPIATSGISGPSQALAAQAKKQKSGIEVDFGDDDDDDDDDDDCEDWEDDCDDD